MIFHDTALKGAYLIDIDPRTDDRGFFARTWCMNEFEQHGLNPRVVQVNVSHNHKCGTLRGIHYQKAPHQESKLVRCTAGAIYDVIIDLRPDSPTWMQWYGVYLTYQSYRMLYVPEGFGHGFQTLEDNSEVTYMVTEFYSQGSEGGIRYSDPAFAIQWPLEVQAISEKDATWPDFSIIRAGGV